MREITYVQAIREATDICMANDPRVFIIGEGVPDPKGIFGTTLGLREKYGHARVMDMPVSENGMTGICIGAAITGLRPVIIHQRIDFGLYAMEQIINNAAKWHYMFNGQLNVPLVMRFVVGRGWGQGPQHSQNLQALFAHIPGLKVVMPSTPYDAKGLLISAIEDNNPVVFIEHRWLHHLKDKVPEGYYKVPIGKSKIIRNGNDVTIASTSYMTIEAIKAADILNDFGIEPEIIDIRTLRPLDDEPIVNSIRKTNHLIVCDLGWKSGGFASEIITRTIESSFHELKTAPKRITSPDFPTPSTPALANYYYPLSTDIVREVLTILNRSEKEFKLLAKIEKEKYKNISLDQPDPSFEGPF